MRASSDLFRILSYTQLYYLRLLAGRNYCHDWYRRPSGKTLQVRRNFDLCQVRGQCRSVCVKMGLGIRNVVPAELSLRVWTVVLQVLKMQSQLMLILLHSDIIKNIWTRFSCFTSLSLKLIFLCVKHCSKWEQ